MMKPTALIRVRDNQRRSRAQRKEYIQDLEMRLHEFECLGVQATVALQAAARKVAKENSLLRSLLGKNGITNVEVESYLHDKRDEMEATSSAIMSSSVATAALRQTLPRDVTKSSQASQMKSIQRQSSELPYEGPMPKVVQSVGSDDSTYQASTDSSEPTSQSHPNEMPELSSLPHYRAPTAPVSTENGLDSSGSRGLGGNDENGDDGTSCETAARIIASMRGHNDAEDAWAELGCSSNLDCTVKNMTIFRVMDQ